MKLRLEEIKIELEKIGVIFPEGNVDYRNIHIEIFKTCCLLSIKCDYCKLYFRTNSVVFFNKISLCSNCYQKYDSDKAFEQHYKSGKPNNAKRQDNCF